MTTKVTTIFEKLVFMRLESLYRAGSSPVIRTIRLKPVVKRNVTEIRLITGFFLCKDYTLNVIVTHQNALPTRKSHHESHHEKRGPLICSLFKMEILFYKFVSYLSVFLPGRSYCVIINSIQNSAVIHPSTNLLNILLGYA